jgi:hypothetical protein
LVVGVAVGEALVEHVGGVDAVAVRAAREHRTPGVDFIKKYVSSVIYVRTKVKFNLIIMHSMTLSDLKYKLIGHNS